MSFTDVLWPRCACFSTSLSMRVWEAFRMRHNRWTEATQVCIPSQQPHSMSYAGVEVACNDVGIVFQNGLCPKISSLFPSYLEGWQLPSIVQRILLPKRLHGAHISTKANDSRCHALILVEYHLALCYFLQAGGHLEKGSIHLDDRQRKVSVLKELQVCIFGMAASRLSSLLVRLLWFNNNFVTSLDLRS